MVEGLVAVPVFMVIFASAVFVHGLYSTKIKTMAASRQNTWSNANGYCFTGQTASLSVLGTTFEIPVPDQSALVAGQEAPGGLLCETEFSESYMESKAEVKMSDYMGGGITEVKSGTRMLCNEKPIAGDFKKGVDYLWNKYGADPASTAPAPPVPPPAPTTPPTPPPAPTVSMPAPVSTF